MQEKNVKFDYIVCATLVMLCCRVMNLEEALNVCDVLARSDLKLTFRQQCYICNHIVMCFLKLESVSDRTPHLSSIFRLLAILWDSDMKDAVKDSAADVSVYLELSHGFRSLERSLKLSSESQQAALLQGCISSVESRIPVGRSRGSSASGIQSHHSSTSSSRASSPMPPIIHDLAPLPASSAVVESPQRSSSELMIANVPISEVYASDRQSVEPSAVLSAATPPYIFVPSKPLPPDSSKFLSREIGELCDEYQIADADRSARLELVKEFDRIVGKWNPAFKVAVYGSFATGLCDRDSDVDLLVATPASLAYMQSHNFYEPAALPPPPLPPVMLDDLFILIQTDPALKRRHERPPR
jgi:hypothetical protein